MGIAESLAAIGRFQVRDANTTSIIGTSFREQAGYSGDTQNASKVTPWSYFRITR
jgi:hypothetical protein